jgi:hypothetical protein
MSSTPLYYASPIRNTIGTIDGNTRLKTMITFTTPRHLQIKVQQVAVAVNIANVMNYGGVNNGFVNVSKDGGSTWTSIQLSNGNYTSMDMIAAGINAAVPTWWKTQSDGVTIIPGFVIQYNLATQIPYITLKSANLATTGTLAIDLSVSQISTLLGFTDPTNQVLIDGHGTAPYTSLFPANVQASIDWYGDAILVWCDGFGPLGIYNGVSNNILCSIPLSTAYQKGSTEYVFPFALPMPIIETSTAVPKIDSFSFRFTGNRVDANGNYVPIYVFDGSGRITLLVSW